MAGDSTAALVVALSAQLSKFEKDMKRAGDIANRSASEIEDRFSKINPSFSGSFLGNFLGNISTTAFEKIVDILKEARDSPAGEAARRSTKSFTERPRQ